MGGGSEMTPEERLHKHEFAVDAARDYLARARSSPLCPPDLEPDTSHAATPKDESETPHPRYRIVVHQRRRRLCDPDGAYGKAAIDGLVAGGILPDDSARAKSRPPLSVARGSEWLK